MKNNKILEVILCVLLAVIIAGGAIGYSFLPHPLNYKINELSPIGNDTAEIVSESVDGVVLKKKTPGEFKVVLFTDSHLDGKNKTSNETLGNMIRCIQAEKPDLVLFGGDNVTSAMNRTRSRQFAEIFEKLGVYWGGVIGNHEGDNPYSIKRDEMVDIFSSHDRCIMRKGPDDIDGNCNYAITLLNSDGRHLETIFCLDTFDEMSDELKEYYGFEGEGTPWDGAHENQVAWFREKAVSLRNDYGDYKSIMLMHIPLPQMREAAESGSFIRGVKNENVCATVFDSGLFDAMKENGVTAAYFGHDHNNNFSVIKDGIELAYLETSGYGSYGLNKKGLPENEWLQGYSVMNFMEDRYTFNLYKYYDVLK